MTCEKYGGEKLKIFCLRKEKNFNDGHNQHFLFRKRHLEKVKHSLFIYLFQFNMKTIYALLYEFFYRWEKSQIYKYITFKSFLNSH